MTLEALLRDIEAEATTLRSYGAAAPADAVERVVERVRRWQRHHQAEVLTLAEAADESGYAVRTLRHKVATGEIPNAGRTNAPRIRRADLPARKPQSQDDDAGHVLDIESTARRIAARRRAGT